MAGGNLLSFLLLSIWVNGGGLVAALGSNDVVIVRYGYFAETRPIHAACGRGWFNLARNVQEDTPEYIVECFPQSSGTYAASRLDNAQLDIASLGSTPWAQAVARGLQLEEIYISHYMGSSQGIYVRSDNSESGYVGIVTPYDLVNRTIGSPFGSTTHYQTLYLIKLFGLGGLVKVVNLSPTEIVKAWNEKRIDGAACWGTARQHVLDNSGKELISSQQIGTWGAPTYVNVAARREFASKHPEFMNHIVGILSRVNDSFLDRMGTKDPKNAARWGVNAGKENNQTTKSLIYPIVDQLMIPGGRPGNPSYDRLVQSRETLDIFVQQSASEQLACEYMGDPNGCDRPTGQEQATINTAKFLFQQKSITTFDHIDKSFFDSTYLSAARTGNGVVTPLGPYENETVVVDNEPGNLGPDPVLGGLEKLDIEAGRSQYAKFEVGRAPEGSLTAGDSNCRDDHIISDELVVNGTIGDGANALPGRSYSDNQFCRWVIHPNDGLVEVRAQKLWLWSGDFLRIYSGGVSDCPGGNKPRKLLAQLSGIYEDAEVELPPFRSNTCIVVEFKTDGNQERGYSVAEDYGDGFELFYSRGKVPEGDCNGKDSDSSGLCLCGGAAWGSDCSHESYCIGTTRVLIEEGSEHVIQSSPHVTQEALASQVGFPVFPYPNDLDCVYELETKDQYDFVKVELYYDLEDTFDLLTLQAGSGVNATQYATLSGSQALPQVYYVPVDENGMASLHLTTDNKGRRRGFYAKVSGDSSAVTECLEGKFGSQCESKQCLAQNRLYKTQQSLNNEFNAGRIISQHLSKAVRAMPWAPNGGCTWEIEPKRDSTGSIRLIIEKFGLEPHTNTPGDKLVIRSDGDVDSEGTELFIQSCKEDDDCEYGWQTGKCSEGGCAIRDQVELEVRANDVPTSVLLVTDRNDGQSNYSGIYLDVHYVQSCPASAINNCLEEGGSCSAGGLCICSDSIACDCSCEVGASNSSSKGRLIAFGILTGVIAILCGAVLYCALVILCYEMRQRYHAGIRRC